MSLLTRARNVSRLFIPPIVTKGIRAVQHLCTKPDRLYIGTQYLKYAPEGWKTQLIKGESIGWNVGSVIDTERSKWDAFCRNVEGVGPLGFSHENRDMSVIRSPSFHNIHISYAYVLALTAHKKDSVSVLDWGGALGHYYLVGKALLPDVFIDYHVKEVPLMAKAGKNLNPEVHWYDDESCLRRNYDLIMMNGSIGYMEDWANALHRIAHSVKDYLFLARLLVVENSPSFVAVQQLYDSQMLHQQLNQTELLETVKKAGLTLRREFVVGDRPYIKGSPEQCEMRSFLFRR